MEKKSELLNQLKIDRSTAEQSAGPSSALLIIGFIIVFSAGAGLGYWLKPVEKVEIKVPVVTQSAKIGDGTKQKKANANQSILNASGYITARRMATVSAEIMGRLKTVEVEEGMAVSQGQLLATLDASRASVSLAYAKAQIKTLRQQRKSAVASLEEAKRNYQRLNTLKGGQYSSEAQLSQAETEVKTLTANLATTDANIELAKIEVQRQQKNMQDHLVLAPFAGVVTVKNAQPGEIVAPSSAGGGFTRTGICTIVDMDSLEIEVDVNESYIGRVQAGQKVIAKLDAYPDWEIPATVIAIIPTADRAKATVKVRISIDQKDSRILPDMGVKVAFYDADSGG